MTVTSVRPEDPIWEIEQAFDAVEAPSVTELAATGTYVDQVFTRGVGLKRWQELRPLRAFLSSADEIVLLSPKAYLYYLPAYLCALVDRSGDEFYLDGVLTSLWPVGNGAAIGCLRRLWEERMPLLTPRQNRCISCILVHIRDRTDDGLLGSLSNAHRIDNMLLCYWGFYLGREGDVSEPGSLSD